MSGRINCLANRSVCFKTYVEGSYFGEIEVLKNCPRIHSVRAEENTTLLEIRSSFLGNLLLSYPEYHSKLVQRGVERHLAVKRAIKKIKKFEMIPQNDIFWNQETDNFGFFSQELTDWIEEWKKCKAEVLSDDVSSVLSYRINRSRTSKKSKQRRRGRVFQNSQLSNMTLNQFNVCVF